MMRRLRGSFSEMSCPRSRRSSPLACGHRQRNLDKDPELERFHPPIPMFDLVQELRMAQTEGRRDKPPAWLKMTDSSAAAIVYMLYILRNIGVLGNRRSSTVAQPRVSLFFPALVLVLALVLVVLPVPAVPAADVDRVVGAAVVDAVAVVVAIECLGCFFDVVARAVDVVVIDLVLVATVVVVVAIALVRALDC